MTYANIVNDTIWTVLYLLFVAHLHIFTNVRSNLKNIYKKKTFIENVLRLFSCFQRAVWYITYDVWWIGIEREISVMAVVVHDDLLSLSIRCNSFKSNWIYRMSMPFSWVSLGLTNIFHSKFSHLMDLHSIFVLQCICMWHSSN